MFAAQANAFSMILVAVALAFRWRYLTPPPPRKRPPPPRRAGRRARRRSKPNLPEPPDDLVDATVARILTLLGSESLLPEFTADARRAASGPLPLVDVKRRPSGTVALDAGRLLSSGASPRECLDALAATRAGAERDGAFDVQAAIDGEAAHRAALERDLADHRTEIEKLKIDRRTVDADMLCPISCEIMKDPVVAADGHSYERVCIEAWLATGCQTSPVTNDPLPSPALLPNHMARKMITAFLDRCRAAGEAPVDT